MLTAHIDRYLALRQTLGFKLRNTARLLRAFARFADAKGDTHIRTSTAVAWATDAPSPSARHIRLRDVVHLARFLHAEDAAHEVPPATLFPAPKIRPLPYIYPPGEVARIVAAAGRLRRTYPLRREVYTTLFGLIAATGLRVSEALDLRFDDLQPNGVLLIRRTKFGKSRLVPLHPTVAEALDRYLDRRRKLAVTDDHVFLSASDRRIGASMVNYTFRRVVRLAGVAAERARPCRIHDLRHTFATRSLQQCSTRRESVSRHCVSLATYLGHADIVHTYWYLEATPELMTDIATAAEALMVGGNNP
jgi:integrase/recombinase XerD